MPNIHMFDNIEESDVKKMLNCFQANTLHFKKDTTILSNVTNTRQIGVILEGSANIIRYNFNGSRTIMESLVSGDAFGEFSASNGEELYVISSEDSKIVLFNHENLITRCKKNCPYHNQLIDNMLQILSDKLKKTNERIEILTKKTIREKLLAYFNFLSKRQISRVITIPFSLTDLADYLSIDRSAMMREIRNLKDEGLIDSKGKKIYLNY
ncbi:MAG: Crp/Fnr family transcriptional regulator [Bacilli bacterium]|nr:Crp/Fnr family transcriptional regulator [Bacilli bacterium]